MYKNGEFYPVVYEMKRIAGHQLICVAGKARLCLSSESWEPLSSSHMITLLSSVFVYVVFPRNFRISPKSEGTHNAIYKLYLHIEHISILWFY